ncbi:MAG TPA: hypothetical protein VF297_24330 [Pyrinomonadaceae bacterium]
MRKSLTTGLLLLAFSCPAFAGEMGTPGSPVPPPSSATQEPTDDATLNGVIHIPPGESESLTQITLELLAVLPSIL